MNLGKSLWTLVSAALIAAPSMSFSLTNSSASLDPEFNSQIFISNDALDEDGSLVTGFCNGTLLSAKLIVTAAHCLKDAYLMKSANTRVQVGHYLYRTRKDGQVARIGYTSFLDKQASGKYFFPKSLQLHFDILGKYAGIGPAEDLALIILDQALELPKDFKFASLISESEFSGVIGRESNYWPTVVSTNPIAEIESLDSKRASRLNSLSFNSSGYFESESASRVEEGDSGAPLFFRIGKEWKLGGVTKGMAKWLYYYEWDVFSPVGEKLCETAKASKNEEAIRLVCK